MNIALPLLLFAGVLFGVVSAQQSDQATETAEDPVVLRAGDYEETRSEFEARFEIAIRGVAASEGMELTDQLRAQLQSFKPSYLEQRATEVVLLQEADERGIQVSDDVVTNRVASLQNSLAEGQTLDDLMEQAGFRDEAQLRSLIRETERIQRTVDAIAEGIEVSDESVQEYYEANAQDFEQPAQVCARHILLDSVEEAEQTLADLEAGADFATLANERTTDPGGQGRGGDLGCFARGRMVPPFEEAAFSAEVGEPVGPVESQFGQHVIQVYDRREAGTADLEEVRPQIEQQLRQGLLNERIAQMREEADVEVFPDRLASPSEGAGAEGAGQEGTGEQSDPAGTAQPQDDGANESGAGESDQGEGGTEQQ